MGGDDPYKVPSDLRHQTCKWHVEYIWDTHAEYEEEHHNGAEVVVDVLGVEVKPVELGNPEDRSGCDAYIPGQRLWGLKGGSEEE